MGRCAVTGMETDNKWRGVNLCREVVQMAKDMGEKFPNKTLRQRLIKLQKDWREGIEQENSTVNEVPNGESIRES